VRTLHRLAIAFIIAAPLPLIQGCRFTTRKLPVPIAPVLTQTVPPEELVKRLNDRCNAIETLRANVELQLSKMNTEKGVATDYTTVPGIILMRKPEHLRVVGFVPVLHTRMFDMITDGKDFTLYVPSRDLAYEGPNTLTHKSTNTVENMRPGFFMDSLIVRCMSEQDEYMVTADTYTIEDSTKKHLLVIPEYILSVMRRKSGSQELRPIRVIHFHREDLLPYQQDLYDDQGNLETQVSYGRYVEFGTNKFPSSVTIKRPLEDFQIVMTVQKVTENSELPDDQFQIQLPSETKVQKLQ